MMVGDNVDSIIAVLHIHKQNKKVDLKIPVDITVHELVIALNQAYSLGMDTSDITKCYLKTENPIAFLKGNKTLRDFKLRNGTVINITHPGGTVS